MKTLKIYVRIIFVKYITLLELKKKDKKESIRGAFS